MTGDTQPRAWNMANVRLVSEYLITPLASVPVLFHMKAENKSVLFLGEKTALSKEEPSGMKAV